MVDQGTLIGNDHVVDSLRYAMSRGEMGLSSIPGLLKRVIKENMWQERFVVKTKQIERFEKFEDFVKTKPLEGLGGTIELLERVCRDDREARELLDKVQGKPPTKSEIAATKPRDEGGTFKPSTSNNVTCGSETRDRGNSQTYLIRRLQRDHPEIADRWARGEIKSVRAAAIEAGIVKVDEPLDVVKKAILKLSCEEFKELKIWIMEAKPKP